MLNISQLQLPPLPQSLSSLAESTSQTSPQKGLFGEMLMDAMSNVANQQAKSAHLVEENLLGHGVTDVEVLTAIKQADLSLKAMVQIRNKTVEAYKELKQIQL